MPVVRSGFGSGGQRHPRLFEFAERDKQKGTDTPEDMDGMRAGEDVKEATRLIAGNIQALRDKLAPGNKLPGNKQKAKRGGHGPKFSKARKVRKREPPPSHFQRVAASQENKGVDPKDARKVDGHPQVTAAAEDDEGAGERHEKHQNGYKSDGDSRGVAFGGGGPPTGALALVSAIISACGRSTAASAADVFNDEFDVLSCGRAWHSDLSCSSLNEPSLYVPAQDAVERNLPL